MESDSRLLPVGLLIKILNSGIEAQLNSAASSLDLTGTQTRILHYLCRRRGENITLQNLEQAFGLNHATLSGIMSRLESKGFVTTETDADDRRRKFLRPTSKAFDCDAMMHEKIEYCEKILLSGLTDEETENVRALLYRMKANIRMMSEEE